MGNSPGPVLGPGLGLQPYQSKKLTFIVKITKEGQKEWHYNQTGHHVECLIYSSSWPGAWQFWDWYGWGPRPEPCSGPGTGPGAYWSVREARTCIRT